MMELKVLLTSCLVLTLSILLAMVSEYLNNKALERLCIGTMTLSLLTAIISFAVMIWKS